MALYSSSLKIKRKELEEVNDDFSDFSLSSPARKIRRLDAELPPIMEEEEHDIPLEFEQLLPEKPVESVRAEVESVPLNPERAIVLFKPVNTPLMQSPSKVSVSVDYDIISGFKNQFPWSSHSNLIKTEEDGKNTRETKDCLAVVPWAPSTFPQATAAAEAAEPEALELMEAEGMDATTMDIEEDGSRPEQQGNGFSGVNGNESLHQWQQQHCMTTQLPQNMSTPITWFR